MELKYDISTTEMQKPFDKLKAPVVVDACLIESHFRFSSHPPITFYHFLCVTPSTFSPCLHPSHLTHVGPIDSALRWEPHEQLPSYWQSNSTEHLIKYLREQAP